jgi:hypothetical protein
MIDLHIHIKPRPQHVWALATTMQNNKQNKTIKQKAGAKGKEQFKCNDYITK